MSWIKMIDEKDAQGKLKNLYDKLTSPDHPHVANILKVHSLRPNVLESHLSLYKNIMFGRSDLTRAQREMIATVVSSSLLTIKNNII